MKRDQAHNTRKIIRRLLSNSPLWMETDCASQSSVSLSYQSLLNPERHIWIETSIEMYGSLGIDIEDWNDDNNWDNSVIHLGTFDSLVLVKIARKWLGGEALEDCYLPGSFLLDLH